MAALELPRIYAQPNSRQNTPMLPQDKEAQKLVDFFFTLAACNTVIVAKHPHKDQVKLIHHNILGLIGIIMLIHL